jgi:hypothetical protein
MTRVFSHRKHVQLPLGCHAIVQHGHLTAEQVVHADRNVLVFGHLQRELCLWIERVSQVDGAEIYRLVVSASGPSFELIVDTLMSDTTFVLSHPLVGGVEYRWRIQAGNVTGFGPRSSTNKFLPVNSTAVELVEPDYILNLSDNYPEPFEEATTVDLVLQKPETVSFVILDLLGRSLRQVDLGRLGAGRHGIRIDRRGLAAGTYLYRFEAGEWSDTKVMLVLDGQ